MRMRKFLVLLLGIVSFTLQAVAQDKVVTGKVTDSNGTPLSGVTIKVKGGKAIGVTKTDGTYSVKVPTGATLQFTAIGSLSSEMQVPANGILDMSLKAGTGENLNEVVVIGYGTAKKKDLTGSVVAISSKDFVKGALSTPEQMIAGKVAGVSVVANDGTPGSGSVIRIRGGASVSASNDPLIVIDGVPVDGGVAGSVSPLSFINPNDVETFTILKDASAAAIYGSRASNGVIIVTTKKGKSGKTRYSFSSVNSLYTPSKYLPVMNANQFREYVNTNGDATQKTLLGNTSTDWQKQIYENAIGTDNNFSAAGMMGKVPFRASVGFLNQDGILKGGNFKRTSASINISPKFFKNHLSVDVNLKGTITRNVFADNGAIGSALAYDPTQPVRSSSARWGGFREWIGPDGRPYSNRNPVSLLTMREDTGWAERSIGNVAFDYKFHFLPDLRLNVNLGYDVMGGRSRQVTSDSAASSYQYYKDPVTGKLLGGTNNRGKEKRTILLSDIYLNYSKETKLGSFDFTAGYSYQNFRTFRFNFPGYTLNGTEILPGPNFANDIPELTLIGVYGRFKYSYKGKYMLQASVRRDGSSRFDPNNRWGTFPSLAAAWRIKEEGFLKNVGAVNDLKFRVSYGVTGQQDGIGLYDYLTRYAVSQNVASVQFGNAFLNYYKPSGLYPRKWEETRMINAAVDFALFNNRVTGTLEYYNRNTIDLLNETDLPAGSNFTNKFVANVGTMKNEGVEATINLGVIRKKDMTLDLSFNATYNKNTITQLALTQNPNNPGNRYGSIGDVAGTPILINSLNYARGTYFVYKQVYDKSTGKPLDGVMEDLNRDGIINETGDLYRYKQVDPVVFFGFSTNFTYKKFSAGFTLRGSIDNYLYNARNASNARRNVVFPDQGAPSLSNAPLNLLTTNFSGLSGPARQSDYYIENASFIRMDNINFGYNFGNVFNNNTNLRIGANVQNAFVITKYSGLDPEVFGGIDNTIYTRPRVFVLSLNLDF